MQLLWKDINEEKPQKGQYIFYIEAQFSDHLDKTGGGIPYGGDIDYGEYVGNNLVQHHCDMAPEAFRYWIEIAAIKAK